MEHEVRELLDSELDLVAAGDGQLVATFNHNSGIFGASGNPNSSAGPGYFFRNGQITSAAVLAVIAVP